MKRPNRFFLPFTRLTVTESTLVLNSSSTAALISGLVAASATRNTYWRDFVETHGPVFLKTRSHTNRNRRLGVLIFPTRHCTISCYLSLVPVRSLLA